jgi:hypothetical protein
LSTRNENPRKSRFLDWAAGDESKLRPLQSRFLSGPGLSANPGTADGVVSWAGKPSLGGPPLFHCSHVANYQQTVVQNALYLSAQGSGSGFYGTGEEWWTWCLLVREIHDSLIRQCPLDLLALQLSLHLKCAVGYTQTEALHATQLGINLVCTISTSLHSLTTSSCLKLICPQVQPHSKARLLGGVIQKSHMPHV